MKKLIISLACSRPFWSLLFLFIAWHAGLGNITETSISTPLDTIDEAMVGIICGFIAYLFLSIPGEITAIIFCEIFGKDITDL